MARTPFARPIAADDSFSLASITNGSQRRDWSEMFNPETGERGFEVVLPQPRRSDVDERASDLWDDYPKEKALYDVDGDAPITDEGLREAFEQSDGGDEWRDSFEPMMNFGWAIDLRHTTSDELRAIADRMTEMAPSCTLIEIGTDPDDLTYEIALTGGGMDLSDHIAGAYIAAGQVPPLDLLRNLSGCFPSYLAPRLPMDEVIGRAAEWLKRVQGEMETLQTRCLELTIKAQHES